MALTAHPGFAASQLVDNSAQTFSALYRLLASLVRGLAQPVADGAMPLLTCICSPEAQPRDFYAPKHASIASPAKGEGMHGPAVKINPEKNVTDRYGKELLWALSEAACGKFFSCA